MRTTVLIAPVAGFVVAVAGCRSAPRGAAELPACSVELPGVDAETWHEVTTPRMAFCVPATWEDQGRRWISKTARVEWDLGPGPETSLSPDHGLVRPRPAEPKADAAVRHFTETIDGRPAELWESRSGTTWRSGVEWRAPSFHFVGEAYDPLSHEQLLAVYRTVRFAGAAQ